MLYYTKLLLKIYRPCLAQETHKTELNNKQIMKLMSVTVWKRYLKRAWFLLTAALANRKTAHALVHTED